MSERRAIAYKFTQIFPHTDLINSDFPLEEAPGKPSKLGLPRRKPDQVVNVSANAIKAWEQHGGATPANPIAERCDGWVNQGYQPKKWPTGKQSEEDEESD